MPSSSCHSGANDRVAGPKPQRRSRSGRADKLILYICNGREQDGENLVAGDVFEFHGTNQFQPGAVGHQHAEHLPAEFGEYDDAFGLEQIHGRERRRGDQAGPVAGGAESSLVAGDDFERHDGRHHIDFARWLAAGCTQ